MIDQASRYRVVATLANKMGQTILHAMLKHWIRYFGAPYECLSDQEGGLKAEETAVVCERYAILRRLGGTGAATAASGKNAARHTKTGVAERAIQITKLCMLKCWSDVKRDGLACTQEDVAFESGMAGNTTLEYGGITPNQVVFGHNPRGLYEMEAGTIVAHEGAAQCSPDTFESYLRLRMFAKKRMHQSLMEYRLAVAAKSKQQKIDLEKFEPGVDLVDLHRMPMEGRVRLARSVPTVGH